MNTNQAISTLTQIVAQKKAINHLDELLDFLQSAESRLDVANKSLDKVKAEAEKLSDANAKKKAMLDAAEAEAAKIKVDAVLVVNEALEAAKAEAADIVAKAKAQAAALDNATAAKRAEADNAMDAAGKAKAKLDQINTELEAAKAKLQKMLG
jgi:chromosome segregation ATPase